MRVVLDTGIPIAALTTTDTPPPLIYQAWRRKRFELITSAWQLDEFRRVTRYTKVRRFLKPAEAGHLVNSLRHQAVILEKTPTRLPRDGLPHRRTLGIGTGVTTVRSATTRNVIFTELDSGGMRSL